MANIKKPLAAALGAAFLASSVVPLAAAESNPFSAQQLSGGYDLPSYGSHEEGGCGGAKGEEGSCGEGSCGGAKGEEGTCGEGKGEEGACGEAKGEEGKCGEGKCGEADGDEKSEGEGKCGEGKCGG